MKKTLSLILAALIAATLCVAAVLPAVAAEPDKNFPLAYAIYGSPVIDGEIDAAWDNAPVNELTKTFVTNGPDPENPTNGTKAQFRAMWDEKYLYLLVEVTDSTVGDEAWELSSVGAGSLWQRNSVGFTVTPDYDRTETTKQVEPSFWLILSSRAIGGGEYVKNDGTANFNNIPRDTFKNFRTKITENGYLIEVAFDLAQRYADIKMDFDTCIGFDLYVNDNIAGISSTRDIGLMWSDSNSYKNNSLKGTIQLVANNPETPVVTEAPVTEAPVTEAPVTEAPVTEAPVTDAPATEPDSPVTGDNGNVAIIAALAAIVAAVSVATVITKRKVTD